MSAARHSSAGPVRSANHRSSATVRTRPSRATQQAAPARRAALEALSAIEAGRDELGDVLARAQGRLEDPRDRALATELVHGTLRERGALDYQLERLSGRAASALDDAVRQALRLGAYQLLHLTRVPPSAVINDSVNYVRSARKSSAAGFVNAVLRRLSREREQLPWPARPEPANTEALAAWLALRFSHPRWLVDRWIQRHGAESAEAWLAYNNSHRGTTLAVNLARRSRQAAAEMLAQEGVVTEPARFAAAALDMRHGPVQASASFREGFCTIQDEGSQLVAELVEASPGQRVLDLCAAPGGKTAGIAAQLGTAGALVACDVRTRRIQLLRETLRRMSVAAQIVHVDTAGPLPFAEGTFHRVLVDAPCSGLGTIRRDPDIKWRRQPADLAGFAALQRNLLARAAPLLAPGGCLLYSTCSSEPEENEAVVAVFLRDHPAFSAAPPTSLLGEGVHQRFATGEGWWRTLPFRDGLDAYFGGRLIRRDVQSAPNSG